MKLKRWPEDMQLPGTACKFGCTVQSSYQALPLRLAEMHLRL